MNKTIFLGSIGVVALFILISFNPVVTVSATRSSLVSNVLSKKFSQPVTSINKKGDWFPGSTVLAVLLLIYFIGFIRYGVPYLLYDIIPTVLSSIESAGSLFVYILFVIVGLWEITRQGSLVHGILSVIVGIISLIGSIIGAIALYIYRLLPDFGQN